MQTLFKKLEYRFLLESTKIDSITFPYKTALSEANVKTYRMGSIKLTFTKNGVLPVTSFLFQKFFFSLQTSFHVPNNHMSIFILFESVGVLL